MSEKGKCVGPGVLAYEPPRPNGNAIELHGAASTLFDRRAIASGLLFYAELLAEVEPDVVHELEAIAALVAGRPQAEGGAVTPKSDAVLDMRF